MSEVLSSKSLDTTQNLINQKDEFNFAVNKYKEKRKEIVQIERKIKTAKDKKALKHYQSELKALNKSLKSYADRVISELDDVAIAELKDQ